MFIKNDTERVKRYFNGKIGIVTELENEKIFVQCKDEPESIEVKKETWENIRYTIDKTTRHLGEDWVHLYNIPCGWPGPLPFTKARGLHLKKRLLMQVKLLPLARYM